MLDTNQPNYGSKNHTFDISDQCLVRTKQGLVFLDQDLVTSLTRVQSG
jgi:hypothetical protein